ncbi:MAG: hypothetical protein KF713_05735 [Turneriella sp.]|nr:hypothetical protein [Turneriella sp.]
MKGVLVRRLEQLINRSRNPYEGIFDPRLKKVCKIGENVMSWSHKNPEAGIRAAAGALAPSAIEYKEIQSFARIARKARRFKIHSHYWIKLDRRETEQLLEANMHLDVFAKSFQNSKMRFKVEGPTIWRRITPDEYIDLIQQRRFESLVERNRAAGRLAESIGAEANPPNPDDYTNPLWSLTSIESLEKLI